jgi:hypothetical protein
MSTTINVTVDDGGLPAKNRQQTAANRQAFVQGRASQQAAQQGADQRAADRRAAGLDPATGRPLGSAGASSRLPRIEQEPAANRRGGAETWILYAQALPTIPQDFFGEGRYWYPYSIYKAPPVGESLADVRLPLTGATSTPSGGPFDQSYWTRPSGSHFWRISKLPSTANVFNFSPLARSTSTFTVEYDGFAFPQATSGGETCRLYHQCYANLFVGASSNPPWYTFGIAARPFNYGDVLQMTVSYIDENYETITIASIDETLATGSVCPSNVWSQVALTLSETALSLWLNGQLVRAASLSQLIPLNTYAVEITKEVGGLFVRNTGFAQIVSQSASSVSAFRFTSKSRYSGNYIPSPIIRP